MRSGSKTLKPGIKVIHTTPGRIRLHSIMIYSIDEDKINSRLKNHPAIDEVRTSNITGNCLIKFDIKKLSTIDVTRLLHDILSDHTVDVWKNVKDDDKNSCDSERDLHTESPLLIGARVAISGLTLLGYSIYRNRRSSMVMANSIKIGNFIKLPSIIALSISLPVIKNGITALIKERKPNADTLSTAAIVASIVAGNELSALTITFLSEIAEFITAYSMDRTRRAIHDLLSVGEEFVWRVERDGSQNKVNIKEIVEGDEILIHTGEKISVDGVVLKGHASVDQAVISGESIPVTKISGNEVFAGSIIQSGTLNVKAVSVGDKTAVSRVIKLVEEATDRKASIQNYADNFSAQLIGLNFFLAFAVFAATRNPAKALNMLIIDYSCGVRLSTATALSMAIASAAKQGVLVKGSDYIEKLSTADTVILDKTGTVTEGRPVLTTIVPANSKITKKKIIQLASAAEESSSHPIAKAVLDKCTTLGYKIPKHSEIEIVVSKGVVTTVNDKRIIVGSRNFMSDNDIDTSGLKDDIIKITSSGESIMFIAEDDLLLGVVGIRDVLKENMKKTINRLRHKGVDDIILLTGDMKPQAELIGSKLSADTVHSEVMPETKSDVVIKRRALGSNVIMVGDGINDAPALAYSDVGIAMGATRTDVAMEAADITIAKDDPLLLPGIINLSRYTMKIIRQNFTASIALNSVGLLLGTAGVLPVVWGAILHNSTTLAVVLNSARVFFYDLEENENG